MAAPSHDDSPYRGRPPQRASIGLVHHRGALASFRTRESAEAYLERLTRDPSVRRADTDPMPAPPPPDGAPWLWTPVSSRKGVRAQLRHYAGPLDAPSPIAELRFEHDGRSTLLHAEFCPPAHGWGERREDFVPYADVDGMYLATGAVWLVQAIGRGLTRLRRVGGLITRGRRRDEFIALLDRHCVGGEAD